MTPEEILAHGEMVTEALKQGLRETLGIQEPPPKVRSLPWTPESAKAHGEMVTELLKQGLREKGIK